MTCPPFSLFLKIVPQTITAFSKYIPSLGIFKYRKSVFISSFFLRKIHISGVFSRKNLKSAATQDNIHISQHHYSDFSYSVLVSLISSPPFGMLFLCLFRERSMFNCSALEGRARSSEITNTNYWDKISFDRSCSDIFSDQLLIVCFENCVYFLACFFTARQDLAWHTNTVYLAENIRKLSCSNRVRKQ